MLKGIVGVEVIEACCIDDAEEEVAQLVCRALLVALVELSLKLAEFLPHLVPHVLFLLPVEAYIPGLVLYAVGLDERGQRFRHAA